MTQEFYIATLDTRHYSFEAYGDSESQAQAAMLRGLKLHAQQRELPPAAVRNLMHDVEIRQVFMGESYRDRTPLMQVPR